MNPLHIPDSLRDTARHYRELAEDCRVNSETTYLADVEGYTIEGWQWETAAAAMDAAADSLEGAMDPELLASLARICDGEPVLVLTSGAAE